MSKILTDFYSAACDEAIDEIARLKAEIAELKKSPTTLTLPCTPSWYQKVILILIRWLARRGGFTLVERTGADMAGMAYIPDYEDPAGWRRVVIKKEPE